MKITKQHLNRIIQEELRRTLNELSPHVDSNPRTPTPRRRPHHGRTIKQHYAPREHPYTGLGDETISAGYAGEAAAGGGALKQAGKAVGAALTAAEEVKAWNQSEQERQAGGIYEPGDRQKNLAPRKKREPRTAAPYNVGDEARGEAAKAADVARVASLSGQTRGGGADVANPTGGAFPTKSAQDYLSNLEEYKLYGYGPAGNRLSALYESFIEGVRAVGTEEGIPYPPEWEDAVYETKDFLMEYDRDSSIPLGYR